MTSVDTTIQLIRPGSTVTNCSPALKDAPWSLDRVPAPSYGPGSSMYDVAPVSTPRQGEIPAEYRDASAEDLDRRIRAEPKPTTSP